MCSFLGSFLIQELSRKVTTYKRLGTKSYLVIINLLNFLWQVYPSVRRRKQTLTNTLLFYFFEEEQLKTFQNIYVPQWKQWKDLSARETQTEKISVSKKKCKCTVRLLLVNYTIKCIHGMLVCSISDFTITVRKWNTSPNTFINYRWSKG